MEAQSQNQNKNQNQNVQQNVQGQAQPIQKKYKKREKYDSIYSRCLINRSIVLSINNVGINLEQTLTNYISSNFEGKCIVEGFVKSGSCRLITYSSGVIKRGIFISFDIVFECDICFPVEGMIVKCIAKNVTKAGIKAESADETPSPIIVFVARDHHYNNNQFSQIDEGQVFEAKIIGQRFELNDPNISVIAELVRPKREFGGPSQGQGQKPKLIIEDE